MHKGAKVRPNGCMRSKFITGGGKIPLEGGGMVSGQIPILAISFLDELKILAGSTKSQKELYRYIKILSSIRPYYLD
jgi:hypothetical protein